MNKSKEFLLYMRNFIFGTEDSLVSTVGLLAGVASAGLGRREIIISGIVLIFVEAFSMAVGSYLSEHSTSESMDQGGHAHGTTVKGALIMFVSYFFSGAIPLIPFLVLEGKLAFWSSIILTLCALFALGFASARVLKTNTWKSAIRMLCIGGIAVALGVAIGIAFKQA